MADFIQIPELNIQVESVGDFNDEAIQLLESFCEDLEGKEGMTEPVPEDDSFKEEHNFAFYWTRKACGLIEAEQNRLYSIGVKYFGMTNDLDISTHMFREP